MAKKQQDDGLFGNIDIEGLENSLITVDVGETEIVADDPVDLEPGGGDPGQKDEPKPPGKKEKPKEPLMDDSILVDITPADLEDQKKDDDDNKPDSVTTEEKKDSSKKGSTSLESESPVYLHAAALQENGVLPDFDLEQLKDLDPDEAILKINEHIQDQIEKSITEGVSEYKGTLGEKALTFIKSLEEGVPFEDLADNYTLEERFSGIDNAKLEENEDLQEAVYRDSLSMKGISAAKIDKMVKLVKDNGELLEESLDSLKEINEAIKLERVQIIENAKKDKQRIADQNTKTKEKIESSVNAVKEILPGTQLTDAEKKELIKMMTVPVGYKEVNGNKIPVSKAMEIRSKDPIAYEMRLNYLIQQGFFEQDLSSKKLNGFFSKQESSASKKLIEKLKEKPLSQSGKSTITSDGTKANFIFPQQFVNS